MKKKKSKSNFLLTLIILAVVTFGGYYLYQRLYTTVAFKDKNYTFIYIRNEADFKDLLKSLEKEKLLEDMKAFEWLALKMKLNENIHPGKYRITNGMTMRQIVNLLKYQKEEKIKLALNTQIRNLEEFLSYTCEKLELTRDELEDYVFDENKLFSSFGLDPDNAFALITPGIYEVSWAISVESLFDTLSQRFNKVWNIDRKKKAKKLGYSVPEVITLASIVQCESHIFSEQEKIAGVYINRLRKNMLLQADPTLKFAGKNFDAKRLLNQDKEINSPYNTYKYKGLPPGPICLVNQSTIDATLNYKKHNYIFFCAKPQLDGYSDFSVNYEEHCKYAKAYQRRLDKIGISR
jgi:UPF0755 protein